MKISMNITGRLWLLLLLVAVLPMMLFSYFNLQQDEVTLRSVAVDKISALADKKAIQVKRYLAERVQDVSFLAKNPDVIDAIGRLSKEYVSADSITAIYKRENAKTHLHFVYYVEEGGPFYDVFLITTQGEIVYTQKHEADFATNLLSGPYRDTQLAEAFRTASMVMEPVISGYEYYSPSQAPALFIVAPVMVDGVFKGMFAVQLGNELFYSVATDATGLGQSGEAAFAQRDGDGLLVTTPLKHRPDAAMKLRLNRQESQRVPMMEAISGEAGAGVKEDYRGKRQISAWRYLPELDWGLVVKEDEDEVLASIAQQRVVMLEALLGLLLLVGIFAYYFGRQISVPLTRLVSAALEVANGNMDQRANESAPGELGQLARAFNRMTVKLQTLYGTQEQRIEERTSQLSMTNEQLREEVLGHRRTERRLLDAHESLNSLLNSIVEGAYGVDAHGYCTFVNQSCLKVLGYQNKDELLGKHMHTLIHHSHPDGSPYPVSECRIYRAYQTVQTINVADEVFWCKDGHSISVEYWSSPIVVDGVAVGAILTFIDITERKQIEDELRVAAIAFETHEAIMITSPDDRIVRVNKAFERITGYRADEVIGHTPHLLSSGKHDQAFFEAMWQQITATGQWEGEIWDKRKNGDIYPKWLTITTVRDKDGGVSHYVGVFSDISLRKLAEEEIYSLAYYDTLTKLSNRRLLQDRFGLALVASERSGSYGMLLFLDLDRFKMLNDTLGHGYGDLLLIEVAGRLKASVREMDTVARMGGDEFVVLIEEVSVDVDEATQKAAHIAEKIRSALAQPYFLDGYEQHSSPSIGVCLYRGRNETVETLLKHADMAMYQAKDAGRNAVRFFDPVMQQATEGRAALEVDLHRAVALQQLHLYYQIQLDNDHRPLGAEALLRWIHPTRGMVSPVLFIPLAEESMLILEIGQWVLESACRQLQLWAQHAPTRDLTLAINVSAQQFMRVDFFEQINSALRKYQINPELLKLELTESVVLEDVKSAIASMHALKGLGVKLSMDDFGTGYSSLTYLKQLPIDQLKIDQSFVRDISSDPNDAVLVKTIIDMARNFRLNVIAEGVETEAQLAFLKQHGCMAYQGYLFSKPVPVAEFEKLVQQLQG